MDVEVVAFMRHTLDLKTDAVKAECTKAEDG